jgi:hypothetical protein
MAKKDKLSAVAGVRVDPDEIQAGIVAAKEAASNITYMGIDVGSRITDDQYRSIVTAIVTAIENYRSGVSI